jgi:large subunit ribosomal protein L13
VDTLSYKTISANKATVNKEWVLIDAENMILGRLASEVAKIIRGKNKPEFTPHVDCGDNVIVINAEKVVLTGNKLTDREHFRHSGYPGGQTRISPQRILDKYPGRLLEMAVKGMLPKNKLGRALFKNLHVVVGTEHKYEAQKPKVIDLNTNKQA